MKKNLGFIDLEDSEIPIVKVLLKTSDFIGSEFPIHKTKKSAQKVHTEQLDAFDFSGYKTYKVTLELVEAKYENTNIRKHRSKTLVP